MANKGIWAGSWPEQINLIDSTWPGRARAVLMGLVAVLVTTDAAMVLITGSALNVGPSLQSGIFIQMLLVLWSLSSRKKGDMKAPIKAAYLVEDAAIWITAIAAIS